MGAFHFFGEFSPSRFPTLLLEIK